MRGTNVVLIGLPAADKSTLGVLVAKRLALDFLDTDLVVQARAGRRLQEILDAFAAPGPLRCGKAEVLQPFEDFMMVA